jgi:hypothetical protein
VRIKGLDESLCDAEVLLIVPPFAKLQYPSLAVHLLQACGRQSGFRVHVLYANILLASLIGEEAYALICDAPWGSFAAERFFARCAFNLPPLGRYARRMFETPWVIYADEGAAGEVDFGGEKGVRFPQLQRLEKVAADRYVEAVAHAVSQRHYKIVGCTTQFDQTTASVALLNRIKRFNQGTTTILGGANCEGEMARGIASLGANIDYIFSGESETTFPWFVRTVLTCSPPKKRSSKGGCAQTWMPCLLPCLQSTTCSETVTYPEAGREKTKRRFYMKPVGVAGGDRSSIAPFAGSMTRGWPFAKSLPTESLKSCVFC